MKIYEADVILIGINNTIDRDTQNGLYNEQKKCPH